MTLFEYVAWFQDDMFEPGDQDHQWPACFLLEAPSVELAQQWGDRLARSYAERAEQLFLHSTAGTATEAARSSESLPIVEYGEEVEDAHIGW
ncbi:MAG: hypothetical protein QNJ75_05115 [Acidimicrobiia bacterium]|nr:hypothetical protein [Acidimicrobiia bacterium]